HMTHQNHVEGSLRWRSRFEHASGLIDYAAFAPVIRLDLVERGLLQHHEMRCEIERVPGRRVDAEVAVKIGPGEHDDQRTIRTGFGEARDGRRRAERVQRAPARGGAGCCLRYDNDDSEVDE